jgi:hypothetical protein
MSKSLFPRCVLTEAPVGTVKVSHSAFDLVDELEVVNEALSE